MLLMSAVRLPTDILRAHQMFANAKRTKRSHPLHLQGLRGVVDVTVSAAAFECTTPADGLVALSIPMGKVCRGQMGTCSSPHLHASQQPHFYLFSPHR